MDISTLIAEAVGPRRLKLEAPREQRIAIDALIPLAKSRIRVFDHDLSDTGWESAEREEALTAFLLGTRGNRLDLLVRDTRYLESRLPRLRRLHQRFNHVVNVHLCGESSMSTTDPMALFDESHYVHRFHFQQSPAAAGLFQPQQTRELLVRFDALWSDSSPTLPPTTLGLSG